MVRSRRTSSNLGGDPPRTGGPAMATLARPDTLEPPSPTSTAPHSKSSSSSSSTEKLVKPRPKRRKARSLLGQWKHMSFQHTWLNPLILILIILAAYSANPGPQNPLHHAIYLSYPVGAEYPGGPIMYGKGKLDFAFVSFYTIVLSFTREFIMQRVIKPWAVHSGIHNRGKQARFMEQVYTAMYFAIFGPFGLYVMAQGPLWYFRTTPMFEAYPHRTHEAIFKAYYLLQASYWAQQAIVLLLQLEKPRKDFKQLVFHHLVTLALIFLSYRFHFAKIGIAVYITHDISDFFLAISKTLNYLDSAIVVPFYALFMLVWIYLRHYINLRILWATLTEFRTVGPFELNWETQQYKCWISQAITFSLLAALQAVNLFWLYLILRIAKNVVFNNIAQDERSEDEAEDDDDDSANRKEIQSGAHARVPPATLPVLLVNGQATEPEAKPAAKPEGVRARGKRKA